jgi:hypothetical protein
MGRGGVPIPVGPDAQAKPEEGKTRGFLVVVEGHTPNSDRTYMDTVFVSKLKAKTAEAMHSVGKDWYVARAELVSSGNRVPKGPAIGGAGGGGGIRAGGRGPALGGMGFQAGQQPSITIPADDPDLKTDLGAGLQGLGGGGAGFAPVRIPGRQGVAVPAPGVAANPDQPAELVIENEDPWFPGEQFSDDQVFKVLMVIRMDPTPQQETKAAPVVSGR